DAGGVLIATDVTEDSTHDAPPVVGKEVRGADVEGRRASRTGQSDPSARWAAFVSASPRWFAPPITTVLAEGPSAEWFDRSLPRHPPEGGPGARRTRPRSARSRASSLFRVNDSRTVNGSRHLYQIPQRA